MGNTILGFSGFSELKIRWQIIIFCSLLLFRAAYFLDTNYVVFLFRLSGNKGWRTISWQETVVLFYSNEWQLIRLYSFKSKSCSDSSQCMSLFFALQLIITCYLSPQLWHKLTINVIVVLPHLIFSAMSI